MKEVIQARLGDYDMRKFNEIKQMIEFERLQGNYLTKQRIYAEDDSVRNSDVIRFLIRNFKFTD